MKSFISYLIEANLGICFFLLVYKILLSKETDHQFNRGYLLLALLVSMGLPFLHFQLPTLPAIDKDLPTDWLPEIQINSLQGVATGRFNSFWFWASAFYILVAAAFFSLFLVRLLKIGKAIYHSSTFKSGSAWIIEVNSKQEVFSFFKFIFISKSLHLTEEEKEQIIRHEQVHIHHLHSVDILFVNLLGILFWFNPFLKTYRKSLVQLHEFEADARSVKNHETDAYCCLLAKTALEYSGYHLANHFTNSLTLKRIEMMKTVKTKINRWKVALIGATALSFCLVMSCTNTQSGDEVVDQVDQLPTFGTGPQYAELYEFIANNLRYPDEARSSKIEGKVFVEFVVEKDGSLSNIKAVKGIGHGCDEEVVRVVKSLPKWNPGEKDGKIVRTKFTIPILFQLSEPKKEG